MHIKNLYMFNSKKVNFTDKHFKAHLQKYNEEPKKSCDYRLNMS